MDDHCLTLPARPPPTSSVLTLHTHHATPQAKTLDHTTRSWPLRRMGAHPNCPSKVAATGESLASVLAAHPAALLGARVAEHFQGQLPYLFKVSER